jgi:cytochrome bd-type quinol oxidase subunit 2
MAAAVYPVLPFTVAYTIFVYRIFHGEATGLQSRLEETAQ